MFYMIILGKHDLFYPLRKRLSKIGLLLGYVLLFGGSDGGPHGDRWSIYVTWTPTRLVETTNVLYDNFRKA